jgi:hypothetical protein
VISMIVWVSILFFCQKNSWYSLILSF